jgi:hypothetical protein
VLQDQSGDEWEEIMHSYLMQSVEVFLASDALQGIDLERKRELIISAASVIHRMHRELGTPLVPANDPQPGNIVYDLAELATLLDEGVPDDVVSAGLREAGAIMMKLCELLPPGGLGK